MMYKSSNIIHTMRNGCGSNLQATKLMFALQWMLIMFVLENANTIIQIFCLKPKIFVERIG